MRGGFGAALKRKMLGGESLFQNTFTSSAAGERLQIAPPSEGDIMHIEMTPETGSVFIQSSGYLASTEGITLDTKWGGAKGFFSGAGLFLVKASGTGDLFINSYGAIHEVPVGDPGSVAESGYIVDTGHILAFTEGTSYKVERVGGLKSFLASGEGLVARFTGNGKVYLNSRNASALSSFLYAFRPQQSN
jgi:uncharacterized protein (TIGR00266 family)